MNAAKSLLLTETVQSTNRFTLLGKNTRKLFNDGLIMKIAEHMHYRSKLEWKMLLCQVNEAANE